MRKTCGLILMNLLHAVFNHISRQEKKFNLEAKRYCKVGTFYSNPKFSYSNLFSQGLESPYLTRGLCLLDSTPLKPNISIVGPDDPLSLEKKAHVEACSVVFSGISN